MPRTKTVLLVSDRSINLKQSTKLGITASPETPHTVSIATDIEQDFKAAVIEVLKFVPGEQDVINTLCSFDNSKASSFDADDQVEFNGQMRLKTVFDTPMTKEQDLAEGKQIWAAPIDKGFVNIERIEVR